jgi:tRNA dimethylallyltransferase
LIAGPTASGKSALAVAIARDIGGMVVNADAMQVYDVLGVLTARPTPAEMGTVPHRLYGTVDPARRYSTGDWLRDVEAVMEETAAGGVPLVLAGGTGLYFEALERGFAGVPEVPAEIVARVGAEVTALDAAGRGRLIAERDPLIAARLKAPDPQRVTRALAVLAATGRSLATYQDAGQAGLLEGFAVERMVVDPGRDVLRERIARRLEAMLDAGAVSEVEALRGMDLDVSLPVMKAIGVREISDWLDGTITREEAVERAVIATRQYAKRQRTWIRNRMGDWARVT